MIGAIQLANNFKLPFVLSDFRVWDWDSLILPDQPFNDGARFLNGLRPNYHYSSSGYSFEDYLDKRRLKMYVNPTTPSALPNYNFRTELSRYPWEVGHPPGTEEWLSWTYFVPDSYTQHATEIDVFQSHPGSAPGYSSNSPAIYFGLEYQNQISGYPWGTLAIVNKAADTRVPTIRFVPGMRIDFVVQLIYGLGSEGKLKIWANGTVIYDVAQSTIYASADPLGSNPMVGGNWKLGVYHHGINSLAGVTANAALGHTEMYLYVGKIRNSVRTSADSDYLKDIYPIMNPMNDL